MQCTHDRVTSFIPQKNLEPDILLGIGNRVVNTVDETVVLGEFTFWLADIDEQVNIKLSEC